VHFEGSTKSGQLQNALVDHLRRHRGLDQRLTLRTGPFAANVPLDMEHARGVVELLAHVLANALHRTAATANGPFRLVAHFYPRQMRRKRAALGLRLRRLHLGGSSQRLELLSDRFEVRIDRLIEEAPLHAVELFATRCKLPALQYRHLVGELLDLELLVAQLLIFADQAGHQLGGQSAQLLRVHSLELIVHLHGFDGATSKRMATTYQQHFMRRESWPVHRCDTRAIRSPVPATARR
jgi:hypothetical protein